MTLPRKIMKGIAVAYPFLIFTVAAFLPTDGGFMPWNYGMNVLVVIFVSLPFLVFAVEGLLFWEYLLLPIRFSNRKRVLFGIRIGLAFLALLGGIFMKWMMLVSHFSIFGILLCHMLEWIGTGVKRIRVLKK